MFVLLFSFSEAQIIVELGDQEETNAQFGPNQFPCIYATGDASVKNQFIIRASEILGAGGEVGNVLSISFNVNNADQGEDMDNFIVRIAQTPITELAGFFEMSPSNTSTPIDHTAVDGWNQHVFSDIIEWDGIQNLIIETCFEGFGTSNHSEMWRSEVGFNATMTSNTGGGPGGGSPCDAFFGDIYTSRPDLRLEIESTQVPPIANFSPADTETCSGSVTFFDSSENEPDSWLWDFGDMTTSTDQDPTHVYTADGVYDVQLIVTNDFGSDTIFFDDLITVALGLNLPIAALCIPSTTNNSLGFGIVNVELNTINNFTGSAALGFEDHTCLNTTLVEGDTYDLGLIVTGPADNFTQGWIDFNNNGDFEASESLFQLQFLGAQNIPITIPSGAVLNTPLRMRIAADFYQLGAPNSCGPYSSGQGEDYTVFIEENTEPPVAAFSFSNSISCDGVIQFFDESENIPTVWLWDFGDTETSFLQNPFHTYTMSGTYDVSLTVVNGVGNDVTMIIGAITVDLDQAINAPVCEPQVLAYCCGYGIVNFIFDDDIDHASEDGVEGYQDNSCEHVAEVIENEPANFFVQHSGATPHDTKIWVDFNNDGSFTSDELIGEVYNTIGAVGSYTFNASPILDTKLRMRVTSDVIGSVIDGCSDQTFGQTEDYAIIIYPALMPPIPDFVGFPLYSCDGVVEFEDLSGNTPTSWEWNFGDMNTSDEQNPTHTYGDNGVYTVTLIVTNDDGSQGVVFSSYVVVDNTLPCNIETLSPTSASSSTECQGMMLDSGEFMDYLPNSDNSFVVDISGIIGTNIIQLNFLEFDLSFPDIISIYDGPDNTSPLIGTYSGSALPNGGTVNSTGDFITVEESTNDLVEGTGFVLTWDCINVGIYDPESSSISVFPNPSNGEIHITSTDGIWNNAKVEVFDILGKMVYSERISSSGSMNERIDLSSLSSGGYSLKLSNENVIVITKIVLE